MRTHHCAGAFAIEVKITNMKIAPRLLQALTLAAIDRAGQAELRVVGDIERRIEILSAEGSQHRPEDFFLRDARHRINLANHGWLDEPAALIVSKRPAAGEQFAFPPADLDIFRDGTM